MKIDIAVIKRMIDAERAAGPVRKHFEVKAADAVISENTMRAVPSVMGLMDRGEDCIYPGAYGGGVLDDFLKNGFVADSHDWSDLIAMPISAAEDGNKLVCEAEFHSTVAAQEIRTICMERIAKGLSVALSVGFMPDYEMGYYWCDGDYTAEAMKGLLGVVYFDCGETMLAHAKANGYDMSLFDTKSIKACKDYCRAITHISQLYEFSVVGVGMNQSSFATDVKSAFAKVAGNAAGAPTTAPPPGMPPKTGTESDIQSPPAADKTAAGESTENEPAPPAGFVLPATVREFEKSLRDAGYPNALACAIASKGFAAAQRDSAGENEGDIASGTPPREGSHETSETPGADDTPAANVTLTAGLKQVRLNVLRRASRQRLAV